MLNAEVYVELPKKMMKHPPELEYLSVFTLRASLILLLLTKLLQIEFPSLLYLASDL